MYSDYLPIVCGVVFLFLLCFNDNHKRSDWNEVAGAFIGFNVGAECMVWVLSWQTRQRQVI